MISNEQYKEHKHYGFFAMVDRMRFIKRWSLMYNLQSENLSEHSLMVAMIVHCLGLIRNLNLLQKHEPQVDANDLAVRAMYHDFTETLTGDLPTPIKYFDESLRSAYQNVEQAAERKLIEYLPEALKANYIDLISNTDDTSHRFIKSADCLAAYLKCQQEVHAGNREFIQAMEQTYERIQTIGLPEALYFLEQFGHGFTMSLDELNPL